MTTSERENTSAAKKPNLSTPLARGLMSRRTFGLGAGVVGASAFLAACGSGPSGGGGGGGGGSAEDRSEQDMKVVWSNWPEYHDSEDPDINPNTIQMFEEETGISVEYHMDVNDNDQFFAKIQPQLAQGQDTGRDIMVLTDWMVSRLMRLGWVQELDHANLPLVDQNLEPSLKEAAFDPGRKFSIPWQSGFTGIGWNPTATKGMEVLTIEQLLTEPSLKGKVTLLTEMRDSMSLVMLDMDIDPATFTADEFDAALDRIRKARDSGQILRFTGNDFTADLAKGDIAACMAWTGDIVQLQHDNPDLGYKLPDKGHPLWSDNFCIPNLAQHKLNAEKLINFYYDPTVQEQLVSYVNYIPPVVGTQEIAASKDPDLAINELIFPDEATKARSHIFRGLTEEEETEFNAKWADVQFS